MKLSSGRRREDDPPTDDSQDDLSGSAIQTPAGCSDNAVSPTPENLQFKLNVAGKKKCKCHKKCHWWYNKRSANGADCSTDQDYVSKSLKIVLYWKIRTTS